MTHPALVKVVWRDAALHFSVRVGEHADLVEVETVGWLTKRGRVLNVAAENASGEWRGVTFIPRAQVVRIVPLREGVKS